ncbi:MAG: hypothetical protein AB7F86_11520 [Bdellovibrionales bacterium]
MTAVELFEAIRKYEADKDLEGAEEFLLHLAGEKREWLALIHLELGRLYARWNLLTSSIHHFHAAVEAALENQDQILLPQILAEIAAAREKQKAQRP